MPKKKDQNLRNIIKRQDKEIQDLREAIFAISTMAVALPRFEVIHEGGVKAASRNIVAAIHNTIKDLDIPE